MPNDATAQSLQNGAAFAIKTKLESLHQAREIELKIATRANLKVGGSAFFTHEP